MVITNEFFKKSGERFIEYLEAPLEAIREYLLAEERYLINNIDPGTRAFEVGCGSGRIMKILADICEHVTGIDNSEYLLKIAEENLKDIGNTTLYDPMDIGDVDKIIEKYDIITLMDNTFGNITGREKQINILKKLKPLLNENGRIIISVYSDSEETKKAQEDSYKRVGLTGIKHHGNYTYTNEGLTSERFTKETLESILKEANLIAEIEELTQISYICEAKIIRRVQ